jgi:hypothetical protein
MDEFGRKSGRKNRPKFFHFSGQILGGKFSSGNSLRIFVRKSQEKISDHNLSFSDRKNERI